MKAVGRAMGVYAQLAVGGRWPGLVPGLMKRGLSLEDAAALAHNAVFLWRAVDFDPPLESPEAVLRELGAGQIAGLCERYLEKREALEAVELLLPGEGEEE